MKIRSRRWKALSSVVAGAAMFLTGMAINAAPAAAASYSGCSSTSTKTLTISGGSATIAVRRNCKVFSGSKTYYDQDFIRIVAKDTSCDGYGPRVHLGHGGASPDFQFKHTSGCNKSQVGEVWTNSVGSSWYGRLELHSNSKGVKNRGAWHKIA